MGEADEMFTLTHQACLALLISKPASRHALAILV